MKKQCFSNPYSLKIINVHSGFGHTIGMAPTELESVHLTDKSLQTVEDIHRDLTLILGTLTKIGLVESLADILH